MNNTAMLLRLPVLGLLTSGLGIHYIVANVLTLLLLFVLRFGLSDRFIWAAHTSNAPSPSAAPAERSLRRDVASLGLTLLGKEFHGDELVRHLYGRVGVELPPDLRVSTSPTQGAAEPGDIVVLGAATGIHLTRGTVLEAAGGRVRMRRLDDAELSSMKVVRLESSAVPQSSGGSSTTQGESWR